MRLDTCGYIIDSSASTDLQQVMISHRTVEDILYLGKNTDHTQVVMSDRHPWDIWVTFGSQQKDQKEAFR